MEIIDRQEHEKDDLVENENIGISSSTLAKMRRGIRISRRKNLKILQIYARQF